ncbi:hypothetical protein MTR67_003738 [Solanum verrucosum]|uniref:Uncharacterized protein n=1 Tax=Solanum verrucosum TaxID=315347 RepID=A0AAF0PT30_SOLVR|nr:hypothetical protein MTR67_003738 [Solanum verrucosum]
MDREQTPNAPLLPPPMRPTVHQDDADEEDETVKQLNECSSVYLSLQDCLINSDRNWKSCQKGIFYFASDFVIFIAKWAFL